MQGLWYVLAIVVGIFLGGFVPEMWLLVLGLAYTGVGTVIVRVCQFVAVVLLCVITARLLRQRATTHL